jgi:hypothetical protein
MISALKSSAATTVAATSHIAGLAGIKVFATGGLGGVHRGANESFDESADLGALGKLDIAIVCAGVKSILDVGATLERLETLSIGLVGYRTNAFPGFYLTDSGFTLEHRAESAAEIAAIIKARGLSSAASAANAAIDHVRSWATDTPEGDWVSMAVPSDGSYGVPEGLISSFPCVCKNGEYKIVQGLDIDAYSRGKIDASVAELVEERDAVRELGLI